MNTSPFSICRLLGLSVLAAGMSSCSLFKNGKYASQWEIESEVPASLSSGQAGVPSATAGGRVSSDLSGSDPQALALGGPLNLPLLENGDLIEIPKPDLSTGHETAAPVYSSPPEMLSIPGGEASPDLPAAVGSDRGLTALLPAPLPVVMEEKLAPAPEALTAIIPAAEWTPPPPASSNPAPVTTEVAAMGPIWVGPLPTIPLLYGQLDFTRFLTPAPLAPEVPQPPPGQ